MSSSLLPKTGIYEFREIYQVISAARQQHETACRTRENEEHTLLAERVGCMIDFSLGAKLPYIVKRYSAAQAVPNPRRR
jgi:hypothetical protein